jgi:hypothetical protein
MLAVYGRAVTWRHLILTAVLLLTLMGGLSGAAAWWAWHNLAARVVLKEHQAEIVLPKELSVQAQVEQKVQIKLDQTLPVRVPIQQDLVIPLENEIPVKVSIDTIVPIAIDVPVKHTIKVDQIIELDTRVKTRVLGFDMTLPIQGRIPVKADVPIDFSIPVRKELPVALVTAAKVRITEPLRTRIDTVIETRVPIKASMSLPVTAPVAARLTFPQQHVAAGLNLMDLTVPFESVTLAPRKRAPSSP